MNMKQNAFAHHFRIPAVGLTVMKSIFFTPRPARSAPAQILGANAASAAVCGVGIGDNNFARRAVRLARPAQSDIRSHREVERLRELSENDTRTHSLL